MLWLWGALGAFVYAANTLVLALWAAERPADRYRAGALFAIALITGAVFAQGFGHLVQSVLRHGIVIAGVPIRGEVGLVPVCLTIGWASNYLWPRILRKLGEAVEAGEVRRKRG